MNRNFTLSKLAVILMALSLTGNAVFAQLQGVYQPGVSAGYPTLASLVTALNNGGVSGHVTIELDAGFSETAPAGGYQLGSEILNAGGNSLGASRTLTITRKGAGANPRLIAWPGTGATDAIFTIAGADYVTVNGVDLQESASNTSANAQMEWGYALLKREMNDGSIDGSDHIKILNCAITLNRSNIQTAGIYSGNHKAGDLTTLTLTQAKGALSNVELKGNTIRNICRGIAMQGFAAGAETLYDKDNILDSNIIENYGHAVVVTGAFPAPAGIYITGATGNLIRNNNISNITGNSAPNMAGELYGIFHGPAKGGILRIAGNKISLIQDSTTNQKAFYGIRTEIGGIVTGAGTPEDNSLLISGNEISARGSYGGSGQGHLIYHTGPVRSQRILDNVFRDIHYNGLGNLNFIYNNQTNAPSNTVTVIRGNRLEGVFRKNGLGSSLGLPGQNVFINNIATSIGANSKDTIEHNDFSGFDLSQSAPAASVTLTGILDNFGGNAAPYPSKYIARNRFSNIKGVGLLAFNISKPGVEGGDSSYVCHNEIKNVSALANGIQINNNAGLAVNIHDNVIDSVMNTVMNLFQFRGINILGGTGSYINIYNNRIMHMLNSKAGAVTLYGIHIQNGDIINIYNNMIGSLEAPASTTADLTVAGIYAQRGDEIRIYHNTLFLVPADRASAGYSTSGIIYTESSDSVDIRNNIVNVASSPVNGATSAIRRTAGNAQTVPFNLVAGMGGNIYYVPDSANCYLYAEGAFSGLVNAFPPDPGFNYSCSPYKQFMYPRETASFSEDNLAPAGSSGIYAPSGASFAKEGAVATHYSFTLTDILGNIRPAHPDAGAVQFAGSPVKTFRISTMPPGISEVCEGDSLRLAVNAHDTLTVQWLFNGQAIPNAEDSVYMAKTAGVYSVAVMINAGCTDTSALFNLTVNPRPVPVINTSGSHGEILGTGSFVTYQWHLNGNPVNGAQSATHTALLSGRYTVTVTDSNGCSGSSAETDVDLDGNGINHTSAQQPVSIYPNPAQKMVYTDADYEVLGRIYSIDGKPVLQGVFFKKIDVSTLLPGIYMLEISRPGSEFVTRKKLIISGHNQM